MALIIFSIPAMSADSQVSFFRSKHVLKDTRNRLKTDSLEALECLKSWAKEGIPLSNFYRFNNFPDRDSQGEYSVWNDL